MAKSQLNFKAGAYLKDKEAFLKELKQFNESKSIPFKTPNVNGVDIDLYHFYMMVTQRGGVSKVNQADAWDSFLRPLRLPHPCINGSTLLRRIYGTHLEKFERAKAPAGRDDDMDMDDDPRRTRLSFTPRVGYFSGYITASGEPLRVATNTAAGARVTGPSERLALQLLSPLPNEQDFAVNVCTVLAADYSNRLPLASTPHILDFLLAHAGVYNHVSLRDTIGRSYYETRGMYPDEFWRMRAGGGGAKELADETKFMTLGSEQPELMVQALAAHNTLSDCLLTDGERGPSPEKDLIEEEMLEDWVTEPSEEDQLFAPHLPGGARCIYTQRVLQVASIVRSLSFHEENIQHLSKNATLIRFLLLCANSWVGTLRQSGLDTLGNVSLELVIKDPATCLLSRHILSTIQSALVSTDRARVLAALELLNKLAQNEVNEDVLLRALEGKVYADVCSLLTLRDIMVLVCTLECVYALTSLGERASEHVARVPGLVHTLVSLVTVEAQSYGPRACILMRVVETVSGPSALAASSAEAERAQAQQTPEKVQPTPAATPVPLSKTEARKSPAPPVLLAPPQAVPAPAPSSPAPSPAPTQSATNIQQQHLQQQQVQENEQFALAWLRASYEPLPSSNNAGCDSCDVYRQYLACCSKVGRKGVIAPTHFPRLVRSVFGGTVGPNTITVASSETQQIYVGIRPRNTQNKNNSPAGPSSPILKAQLTTKAEAAKPVQQSQPQSQPLQQSSHPHLAQALEPSTSAASNTTLIKHLLAHKVSPASTHQPTSVQVTQRQNQQRLVGQQSNATSVVQPNPNIGMDIDPESLIKCTTITPGGVASSTPNVQGDKIISTGVLQMPSEEMHYIKEEPIQMQIDEQAQLTIKTAQNKMLADLLEKKSNPPVQVVQMTQPQMNPPTIQITETGQIVQVKHDTNPIIQINAESSQIIPQPGQYIQIKNEQGQIIHLKNDQGQIIQLKSDQYPHQIIHMKNEHGQIVQLKSEGQIISQSQVKSESEHIADNVCSDHSYTEPPSKKAKLEDKRETTSPPEIVSKTAANLYAALAASALEDEDDLVSVKQETMDVIQPTMLVGSDNASVIIQEPILQVQQPTMQVQQPTLQVQQSLQMQQPTLQVQQPTLQVQQPMLQVQPMDVQQMQNIIVSQAGQIILQEKPITSQTTHFVQPPMQIIATPNTSQGGLSYITTQNMSANVMQPHKTIIIVQGGAGGAPITLTVNNPGGLDEATLNSLITQASEAITQQQIIQNSGVIQSTQRVIVSQPTLVSSSQPITVVKQTLSQNPPQLTPSQQPLITTQPQPHKAQIINQNPQQQIMVTQKQPQQTLITSSVITNPTPNIVTMTGNQQIISGTQQILSGSQQFVTVSGNQQIIVNAPLKQGMHRVVQQPQQRNQVVTSVQQTINQIPTVIQNESKPSVIQTSSAPSTSKAPAKQQPVIRQVISRQPVMVGSTKIGEKEVIVHQPITEVPPLIPTKPKITTPKVTNPPQQQTTQEDTPWICHWKGCGRTFDSATSVFGHAARTHCPPGANGEAACMWLDCDRVSRRTFALLNHLHDRHCTVDALKAIYMSRRHVTPDSESPKPVTIGYPPNAALAALNKHAVDFLNPRELMDENEGPVTKSIRLTAALILRNIVIYSNTGRRQLRSYEPHLASIALSSVEASRTIAQVLYDMNNI